MGLSKPYTPQSLKALGAGVLGLEGLRLQGG